MTTMLADVINAGTAWKARSRLHAAGRRQDGHDQRLSRRLVRRLHADSWSLVCWVGFDQPRTIIRNGYAAEVAVPMWARS